MRILAMTLAICVSTPCSVFAEDIFADGFETGGLLRWSWSVGAVWPDECQLVEQTGCLAGERCTFAVTSFSPLHGYAACVEEGSIGPGGACAVDGETGLDDCASGLLCHGDECRDACIWPPDTCVSSQTCWDFAFTYDGQTVAACSQQCDIFAQDCSHDDSCYILLGREGYPTLCMQAIPEPAPPEGCGDGLPPPGAHGECCSHVNTCATGTGCLQPSDPSFDHLVCAMLCDPTGTVGPDNCLAALGPEHWCLSINRFYSDVPDLPDPVGFCVNQIVWGPPQCFNGIQDPNEDGVDCCIEPGGNPACPCAFECP